MSVTYSEVWDLDVFFEGGSSSVAFAAHLEETGNAISALRKKVEGWQPSNQESDRGDLADLVEMFDYAAKKLLQAGAFVSCLQAQDTEDKKADQLRASATEMSAALQTALNIFDQKLAGFSDQVWLELVKTGLLKELRFVLDERREQAAEKLSEKEESAISALTIDGYHGWSQMYDLLVSSTKIKTKSGTLSVGQAANKMSDPDRNVRKEVFEKWENAWAEKEDFYSSTLNHLAGFRLNVYKLRGWDDVLKEPLDINRMEKGTLEAMWEVIAGNKEPFVRYLNRKAKLLGLEKLSWYDLDAPVGSAETKMTFQAGADFIVNHFAKFGKEMADFAKMAFKNKWIEAEDRPGKAPGGFHTYFPESGQSRIFMTYSGTLSNVSTLAHELGHGFHTYAMRDLHLLNRNYAMNVAETASTFAEMIVSDAAVKGAGSKEEKLILLEDKIQRSVSLLMNIHARYLFETRFYEERKHGAVNAERLNALMTQAQTEAYGGALKEYHPLFWASKLHFYITGVPFYNFPYTFGFLFSLGIYAMAQEEGPGYEKKYIALLKDSASMTVEDLAKKHLDVDLTKKGFWEKAVRTCVEDVEEFLALTE